MNNTEWQSRASTTDYRTGSNMKRRIALLIELPADSPDMIGMIALRRLLKGLLRAYGLRCLSIKNPIDTKTFGTSCEHPDAPKQPRTLPTRDVRC